MRQVADRNRQVTGRPPVRPAVAVAEGETPTRLRLRRKLERGGKYRKADRRCDEVADLRLREGVDEILRWLRTA